MCDPTPSSTLFHYPPFCNVLVCTRELGLIAGRIESVVLLKSLGPNRWLSSAAPQSSAKPLRAKSVDVGKRSSDDAIVKRTNRGGSVDEGAWVGPGVFKGKRTYVDGRCFEGTLQNGKAHDGHGVSVHGNGIVDEGTWVDGKLSGHCKRTYTDGRTLEGEFKDGKIHNASGVLQHPTGNVEEGRWVEGVLIGKRLYADGRTFEGKLNVSKVYYGEGVIRHSDGVEE
jgi:hypothetical protein